MEKIKIFVYGTLMEGFRNYEKYFKDVKIISLRPAYTKGTLYHLNKKDCPALVDGNEKVWGELIEFEDDKNLTVLKALDDLEKYFEDSDEIMYERREISVFSGNGEEEKAYGYFFINSKNIDRYEPQYIDVGNWRKFVS